MQALPISILSAAAVLWSGASLASTQGEWRAPSAAAAKKNPVPASAESIRLGNAAFEKTCASCHGSAGKRKELKVVIGEREH